MVDELGDEFTDSYRCRRLLSALRSRLLAASNAAICWPCASMTRCLWFNATDIFNCSCRSSFSIEINLKAWKTVLSISKNQHFIHFFTYFVIMFLILMSPCGCTPSNSLFGSRPSTSLPLPSPDGRSASSDDRNRWISRSHCSTDRGYRRRLLLPSLRCTSVKKSVLALWTFSKSM